MKRRAIFTIILISICILTGGCAGGQQPSVLRVAMPYSDNVQDPNNNYYITWLEEQTGFDLDITIIRQKNSSEYLNALFASDADIDIVMFGEDFKITESELSGYIASGDVYVNDGKSYYANTGSSARKGVGQILWINYNWLKTLALPIPETPEELESVLKAFKEGDPNKNGIKDEIPFVGAGGEYALSPVEFILNAYIYNDPGHSRYGINEEADVLYAATDEFREGIAYCNRLYEEGLLDDSIWDGDLVLLRELCNSEADIVGAFTANSISDVVYRGNPEVLARYIHVPPLKGPGGEENALYTDPSPKVGAIITGRSAKKDQAAKLLDLMITPEASLVARYGEQGVDWDYSDGSDVSVYGGVSTITTINYLWDQPQNKHINGIGPMDVPKEYLEGVTWNGLNSDFEYINGRAYMSYEDRLPKVNNVHPYDKDLSEYTDSALEDFVRGKRDIWSDEEWKRYLDGLSY